MISNSLSFRLRNPPAPAPKSKTSKPQVQRKSLFDSFRMVSVLVESSFSRFSTLCSQVFPPGPPPPSKTRRLLFRIITLPEGTLNDPCRECPYVGTIQTHEPTITKGHHPSFIRNPRQKDLGVFELIDMHRHISATALRAGRHRDLLSVNPLQKSVCVEKFLTVHTHSISGTFQRVQARCQQHPRTTE